MKNLLLVLYGVLIILFIFFSYLFVDKNLIYLEFLYSGVSTNHRLIVTSVYALFIFAFFAFYLVFIYKFKKGEYKKNDLGVMAILSCLLVLAYPAIFSYDIFNYLATAKVLFHYGENPYMVMPIEFNGDPMLLFTRAANKYALYGPTWIILTGAPFLLSFGSFLLQVILLKIILAAFYIGTLQLMYKLSKSLYVVSFFALNPLVIFEIFVSGHNDIVMMFFVILSLFLVKEDKNVLSLLSFVTSVFVKFASIFILPVFLYIWFKRFRKKSFEWDKVWLYSLVGMTIIFLASPLREEMYPWYFVWILPFAALLKKDYGIRGISIALSVGLLASYIPYMYIGDYLRITLILKYAFVMLPVALFLIYKLLRIKLYEKKS